MRREGQAVRDELCRISEETTAWGESELNKFLDDTAVIVVRPYVPLCGTWPVYKANEAMILGGFPEETCDTLFKLLGNEHWGSFGGTCAGYTAVRRWDNKASLAKPVMIYSIMARSCWENSAVSPDIDPYGGWVKSYNSQYSYIISKIRQILRKLF